VLFYTLIAGVMKFFFVFPFVLPNSLVLIALNIAFSYLHISEDYCLVVSNTKALKLRLSR
jgi:hypothetical protein